MHSASSLRWLVATLLLSFSTVAFAAGDESGHAPSVDQINWFYGMVGEKEGVEPSLLWRPPGMPAPYGALLLNALVLYALLFHFFKKPILEGLAKRKSGILRGMEEASRMKREAEQQLAGYQAKLAGLDQEIARIQREMRASGEAERAHVLHEARQRHLRMERDARVLIEQELKALREQLVHETLATAVKSAELKLRERLGAGEQHALAELYLTDIKHAAPHLRGRV